MRKGFFFIGIIIPGFLLAQGSKPDKTKALTVKSPSSSFKSTLDSFSYAIAMNIGFNMKQQGVETLNILMVTKAFNDVMKNKPTLMDMQASNACVNNYFKDIAAKKLIATKAEEAKFLAENKKRPTIVVTPSGLQYEILKAGDGIKPVDTNTVKVHYTGTLINGKKFDSSVDRGEPVEFSVTGVIPGWTEALKLMPVGSKWRLYIPSDLGYGDRGQKPDISPGATLIFEVELLAITN